MNTKVRLWHVLVIVACAAAGVWVLQPPGPPPPPDFTPGGFSKVRAEFRQLGNDQSDATAESTDASIVAGLIELVRAGEPVVKCRCAALGSLEFQHANGSGELVRIIPAHDPQSVEFQHGGGRYRMDRAAFLRLVEPLGVPLKRWYECGQ